MGWLSLSRTAYNRPLVAIDGVSAAHAFLLDQDRALVPADRLERLHDLRLVRPPEESHDDDAGRHLHQLADRLAGIHAGRARQPPGPQRLFDRPAEDRPGGDHPGRLHAVLGLLSGRSDQLEDAGGVRLHLRGRGDRDVLQVERSRTRDPSNGLKV